MDKFRLKNGQEVIIRFAQKEDYEEYCAFFEKLAEETIFTNQYIGRPRRSRESFEAQINSDNIFRLIVVNSSAQIVGTCSVVIERPEHPWLNKNCDFGIMLLKDYTGQGLGSYLMQKMENWARVNNMHRIGAQVRAKNISAIALYLKCGFEIEGMAREVAYIDSEWHNQYYIGKIL